MNPSSKCNLFYRESLQYHRESLLTRNRLCVGYSASQYGGSVGTTAGQSFAQSIRETLSLRSIEDELSVLESQIQGLLEKHSQLYEQKTMLETSQVKDTLREHRLKHREHLHWGFSFMRGIYLGLRQLKLVSHLLHRIMDLGFYQQRKSNFRARTSASLTQSSISQSAIDLSHSVRQVPLSLATLFTLFTW